VALQRRLCGSSLLLLLRSRENMRATYYARGNDFGVDEVGGSGGGNSCATLRRNDHMTKEVGRSDAGTVEGITSVSKEVSRPRIQDVAIPERTATRERGRKGRERDGGADPYAHVRDLKDLAHAVHLVFPLTIAPFGESYEKNWDDTERLASPLHKDDSCYNGRPTVFLLFEGSLNSSKCFPIFCDLETRGVWVSSRDIVGFQYELLRTTSRLCRQRQITRETNTRREPD
jgi:hypothetical protein